MKFGRIFHKKPLFKLTSEIDLKNFLTTCAVSGECQAMSQDLFTNRIFFPCLRGNKRSSGLVKLLLAFPEVVSFLKSLCKCHVAQLCVMSSDGGIPYAGACTRPTMEANLFRSLIPSVVPDSGIIETELTLLAPTPA